VKCAWKVAAIPDTCCGSPRDEKTSKSKGKKGGAGKKLEKKQVRENTEQLTGDEF